MSACLLCPGSVNTVLDLGPQPVTCHFLSHRSELTAVYPFSVGVCDSCATVQLLKPFPADALTPRHPWITYREPEDHLDPLVEHIATLEGISPKAVVLGVSFKDRTTVDRLSRLGFSNGRCLDVRADLGAQNPNANIESVQALLTLQKASSLVSRYGQADIVIARHVVEHATAPRELLEALSALVRDGGYLVLEVPDCAKNIARQDYAMLWEEHALYFTARTFRGLLSDHGFRPTYFATYPYFFEDCLVQIACKNPGSPQKGPTAERDDPTGRLKAYADALPRWTHRYRQAITRLAGGAPIALYGAGHLTAAFVNFHGLSDLFPFVVDDTPEKQGLALPNSGIEIVSRKRLNEGDSMLCLLGLSPHAEEKVIEKNQDFTRRGGQFYSIFVDSPRSLRLVC
jgi:hypothetical protein